MPSFRRCRFAACNSLMLTLLLGWLGVPAAAQEIRPGDKVTVIHWDTELKSGKEVVATVAVGTNLDVGKVDGDWLWIATYEGYVKRSDVVPYGQAVQHFTAKIQANPDSSSAYHDRACVWYARDEHDIAIKDFTDAIRHNPYAASYHGRAHAWKAKGDTDKAIADYTEAIRLNPSYARAFTGRASAWEAKQELDKALADYTDAIRLHPTDEVAWQDRGLLFMKFGSLDKAVADLDEAVRLNPSNWASFHFRGRVHRTRRDYKAALIDAERCQAIGETTTEFSTRGVALFYLGRPHEAIESLENGFYKDDSNHGPRAWLAMCRSAVGDHVRASDELRSVVSEGDAPGITKLLYAQFLASCPSEQYRNGQRSLDLTSSGFTESLRDKMLDTRAMAHAECGDFAAAIASQKEAIALAESRNYHADYITGLRERLKLYEAGQPYRHPVYPAPAEK